MAALRCTIVEVMETWPLQLQCEGPGGRLHVGLLDATAVERAGSPAGPGSLRPGMQVVIDGELSGQAMIARRIEILSST